jgi:hypothetical protein
MHGLGIDYRFINNGDDCGVIVSRSNVKHLSMISEHFAKYGFRLEVEKPVFELEKLEFCQMNPVFDGTNWRMMRKVYPALQKDSMSLIPFNDIKLLRKWIYSVGECGLALCSGLPVMQDFYQMYCRLGVPSNIGDATYMECGARQLARGLVAESAFISDEARFSFYIASGIPPMLQMALEGYYSSIHTVQYNEHEDYIPIEPLDIL